MSVTQIGQTSGTIEVAGDSDWFKVTLTAGTQYVFDVGGGTLQSGQVSLYDANGNLVSTASSAYPGAAAETSFTVTSSGTYYVAAAGVNGSTGTYNVIESTTALDNTGNTSTTASLSVGGQATGNLTVGGQNDLYKISLNGGTQYVFTAAGGAPSDVQVTIYNSSGQAIANSNQNGTVDGHVAVFEPTAGGTYYIGVSSTGGSSGAFTLSATTAPFNYADNTTTTGTIAAGGSVSSTISAPGQSEWYKISLTAGTNYVFNVGGGTLTGGVELYDANGNLLVQGYNGGTNGEAATSFEPTASGTYYVAASSFLSTTGSYTLSVSTHAFDYAGTTATTGTLTSGSSVNGTLAVTGQSDWFKVSLTSGTQYLFDVGGGTLASPEVTIYDSTGKAISAATIGRTGGGAQLSFEPTASGTYYIGASGQPSLSTGGGTYTVSMSTATYGYLGNTLTSGTLAVGGHNTGNITSAGQSEWFKVSLTAAGSYVFDVAPGTLSDAQVSLYNSSGTLVSTGGTEASIAVTAAGTYFVGVTGSHEGTGSFTVSAATYADDQADNTSTTGIVYADLTAAAAIAQSNAGTLTAPIVVLDSAADIQANLDALEGLAAKGLLHGIQPTDANSPVLTISEGQLTSDATALNDIIGTYSLMVTGVSVADATKISTTANVIGISVTDTGANIGAGIDGLQNLVNAGLLNHITVSDGTLVPVTQDQLLNDATALAEITGNYGLSVTGLDVVTALSDVSMAHVSQVSISDAAVNIGANLDALQSLAAQGKLGTVSVNDANFDPLSVSVAQMTNDATVLNKLSGNFFLSIDGSGSNITVNGIAGHGNILDLSGASSQYTVTPSGDGNSFTLTNSANGSVDHLSGINALQFSDDLDIVSAAPGQNGVVTTGNITELYSAVLAREPDVPGLGFYLSYLKANPDTPLVQFAQYFLASSEYTSNPARDYTHNQAGDDQFITDTYENLLHRAPEAGAIPYYEAVINTYTAGFTPGSAAYIAAENLGHAWVLTYASASPEFLNDVEVTAAHPADATHWLIAI
jgi:hypothetical protein